MIQENKVSIPEKNNFVKIYLPDKNKILNNDTNKSSDKIELCTDSEAIIEQNHKYFIEYKKLYEASLILNKQLYNLLEEKRILKQSLQKIEFKKLKNGEEKIKINDTYTNRKRRRRTKKEINRDFKCHDVNCKKSYGSQGSLNQHLKLKHKNYV